MNKFIKKMNVDFDVYEKYLKKPQKVDEVEELTDVHKKKLKKWIVRLST